MTAEDSSQTIGDLAIPEASLHPNAALARISLAKNRLISAAAMAKEAADDLDEVARLEIQGRGLQRSVVPLVDLAGLLGACNGAQGAEHRGGEGGESAGNRHGFFSWRVSREPLGRGDEAAGPPDRPAHGDDDAV